MLKKPYLPLFTTENAVQKCPLVIYQTVSLGTLVNRGKKRKGPTITELLENPVVRTFYPARTVGRPQGLPSAKRPPGPARLAGRVGYLTLQFFGFGASTRSPSSVVFVGMMNVA